MSNHARWHSRTSFLATTLMILVALGAPFMVAGGMLEHGALFLPLTVLLIFALGTPLVRLSLASGQSEQEIPASDAALGLQWLLRLALAGALLYVGAQAAGWAFSAAATPSPDGLGRVSRLRLQELSALSADWHGLGGSSALATGGQLAGVLVLVLLLVGLKRRLAALSWLGTPLLMLFSVLLLGALAAAFWFDGPSGLAAMSAPMKARALGEPRMWAEAAALALLAVGAQSGIISAAGRGLPARAEIGREARILLCGTAFFTALTGMTALMLLCMACLEQGLIPQPTHARAMVLALDLVPTLAELPGLRDKLFAGWPQQLVPSPARVAMVWTVLVAIVCSFCVACLLVGGRWRPAYWRARHLWLGVAGAAVACGGLAASGLRGVEEWWWPVFGVLPALLALMRLAIARRPGTGIRVSSIAFESSSPRLQTWHFWYSLNLVRPALVAVVALATVTHREHGLALGGLAVGFGLMWAGSLTPPPRDRRTQRLAPVAAAGLLFLLAAPALAQPQPPDPLEGWPSRPIDRRFEQMLIQPSAQQRALLRREVEEMLVLGEGRPDLVAWHARLRLLLARRQDPQTEEVARALAGGQLADGIAVLMVADGSDDAQDLERRAIIPQAGQAQQLLELWDNGKPRDRALFAERVRAIQEHLRGPALEAALRESDGGDPAMLLAALVDDMRRVWGAHGPEGRRIRVALTQTMIQGRTLLRPRPSMGLTCVVTLVLCAAMLAVSLLMGLGTVRRKG